MKLQSSRIIVSRGITKCACVITPEIILRSIRVTVRARNAKSGLELRAIMEVLDPMTPFNRTKHVFRKLEFTVKLVTAEPYNVVITEILRRIEMYIS